MSEHPLPPGPGPDAELPRREFLKRSLGIAAVGAAASEPEDGLAPGAVVVDDFDRPNAPGLGDGWESLNPGYWMVQERRLRRRLRNRGDQRPGNHFPWHWESNATTPRAEDYDPSLPYGMAWRRDWRLRGNYTIRMEATVRALPPRAEGSEQAHHAPGYAVMGIGFGTRCLHESWVGADTAQGGGGGGGERAGRGDAAWMALWRDDGRFGVYDHDSDAPKLAFSDGERGGVPLRPGDRVSIELAVTGRDPERADVTATLRAPGSTARVAGRGIERALFTDGYFGLVARGLLDWEVHRVSLVPGDNRPQHAPQNELHLCYALGDSLREEEGAWRCRFVALFRNAGQAAEIRIADDPAPPGGWAGVPVAGRAAIVSNGFRRNTAVLDVRLPSSPADGTLFFTVWKDGRDVTADPRIGTASTGPGTGFVGQVPASGVYVGRLPQLRAPYRLCGLSCHAVAGNRPNLPEARRFQQWYVNDQPTPESFRHLEELDFQVMVWEDDVWYLELMFPPPSTDDAYKVIQLTLGGPTTRWQMMRHWNVLNPGDHDYGMDDVKGPEQILVRTVEGLGQDPEYMRRNFEIVRHLMSGEEEPSGTGNPKWWRRWKMPDGDFALLVLDSRLWRSSQDTDIWDDEGWGHRENLYDRRDPTRALLGEEQFAWLQEVIRTDSSPLLCLTGINALHTVWAGNKRTGGADFDQRDRVAADYAGWVAAGADRVLELLGSRTGVVTIYGDVHTGCILRGVRQGVYECSFGPIGRTGSRAPKPGFGPRMTDFDGREVEVHALYHERFGSPALEPITGPTYWNFLDAEFDPRPADPRIRLRIRNLVDGPDAEPRGGGEVDARASATGRSPASRLPAWRTLPGAEIRIAHRDGRPVRGLRALADGTVPAVGLMEVPPGTRLQVTAINGDGGELRTLATEPVG